MGKQRIGKTLLIIYLVILVWILLFKFSISFTDIAARLAHPMRSVNLIPFQESMIVNGKIALNEIILNAVIFMPLGVLLGISSKKSSFFQKSIFILLFSLFIETMQFILGIGATDVTDLLMNFGGGFIGLSIYQGLRQVIPETKLDKTLIVIGSVLGILCLGLMLLLLFLNH